MKRLWKVIPPCMSDILGFEEVMNHTKGLGVVDDASGYKPLRHERLEGESHNKDGFHEKREFHKKGGFQEGVRVITSDISEADIITGTERKVLDAFDQGFKQYQPEFALFTTAPCASMINTDLEMVAEQITKKYGVPSAGVNLDGQKDYLYGISCTLEAMGQLLLEKKNIMNGTVNILGYNSIDWAKDSIEDVEKWLTESGFQVLSRWGVEEDTDNLKNASAAEVNLVVNVAGLRLARFMKREFGIPYVVGAPFGESLCKRLKKQLQSKLPETEENCLKQDKTDDNSDTDSKTEVLIIGEQLEADAIRMVLLEKGYSHVNVMSFYEMDKEIMLAGDQKLTAEAELAKLLDNKELRLVIADADYKGLCKNKVSWIPLPNLANQAPAEKIAKVPLVGEKLDQWIDENLTKI